MASRSVLPLMFVLALTLGACGSDSDEEATPDPTTTTEANAFNPNSMEPPPVELTREGNTVSLEAWTYCWTPLEGESGICADGSPPANPPALEGAGPITLEFPVGFDFSARVFDRPDGAQSSVGAATVTWIEDNQWQIDVDIDEGSTGPFVLEVFGRGEQGDVIISVAID